MASRALVIGSTGLVGSNLVQLLLSDDRFERVVSLVRRSSGVSHPKLDEHVIDFRSPESFAPLVRGDVLFSTLGTTIRAAKTKEAQYEVDHTFQYEVAKLAKAAGVRTYVLVSSMGADPKSRLFYSRMKGELERDVSLLGFPCLRILRPSLLAGDRQEGRFGERFAFGVASALAWLPGIRTYRPIDARVVARAMIAAWADPTEGYKMYKADELFLLAGS